MPNIPLDDVVRMRDAVFFDGPDVQRRVSRFWILLVLASIIASAGVVTDSTATVIGAMIVAPLMIPIQGTMLAVVLGDRANLIRSIGLVLAGSLSAIAVGWLVGLAVVNDVVAHTNSQVAGRVSPGLIDLLAALATGVVGSVALVRRDISDTLPGVAIAISLVPPLTVVGLTLEAGAYAEAAGALLLFVTNVVAILGTGIVVMAFYRVQRMVPALEDAATKPVNRRSATLLIGAMVVLVGAPLALSSFAIAKNTSRELSVRDAASEWAAAVGWDLIQVTTRQGEVIVRFEGPLPVPEADSLRAALIEGGLGPNVVQAEFVPKEIVDLGRPTA